MKSRTINPTVLRVLYARSGNKCSFPGCYVPIFEDNNQLTGECCHIEAFSKGGPRYNELLSDRDCNGYDNLMLMCSRHHKIIDGDVDKYSVKVLKEMKSSHEGKFRESDLKLSDEMVRQIEESSYRYWDSIRKINLNDTSDLHREFDFDLPMVDLIDIVDKNFDEIETFIKYFEISDHHLMADLQKICNRLNWNFDEIENLPYFENPFHEHNWEMHNLGRPNHMNNARMYYYALIIKVLEQFTLNNGSFIPLLEKWRTRFYSFQKDNYFVD